MPDPQPPRKRPRQQRSRELVAAIIEAAARVFGEHGYGPTSMTRVAEVAGVSVGSMYQYFADKRSLVTALHERHTEDAVGVVEDARAKADQSSLEESVRHVVRGLLHIHRKSPGLQRVLHDECPALQYRKADSPKGRALVASTTRLLEAHGEVRHDNLTLAAKVVARIVEELVHDALLDPPGSATEAEMEQSIVDAAVGYLCRG